MMRETWVIRYFPHALLPDPHACHVIFSQAEEHHLTFKSSMLPHRCFHKYTWSGIVTGTWDNSSLGLTSLISSGVCFGLFPTRAVVSEFYVYMWRGEEREWGSIPDSSLLDLCHSNSLGQPSLPETGSGSSVRPVIHLQRQIELLPTPEVVRGGSDSCPSLLLVSILFPYYFF